MQGLNSQSFREQNARSMRLRSRYATASYGMGCFRDLVEGMTASAWSSASILRKLLASYPLSAIKRFGAGVAASSAGAAEMSATFPRVNEKAATRPQASVRAWILVVGPPRERPMA